MSLFDGSSRTVVTMNKEETNTYINELNTRYSKLDVYGRVTQLYKDFDTEEIKLTSSKISRRCLI